MTLELILWLVAWVVISEVVFVIIQIKNFLEINWVGNKLVSFCIGGVFIFIQGFVVFGDGGKVALFGTVPHYINLVYEAIVLGVIAILFLCNWLISKKIEEKKGKK